MSFPFCENCLQGHELKNPLTGAMTTDNKAYFAPGIRSESTEAPDPATATPSKNAIILATDVFGLPLRNCKVTADQFAEKTGFDVWVPDLFNGSPVVREDQLATVVHDTPGQKTSWTARLKFIWLALFIIPKFFWIRASVVDGRVTEFVKKLKEEKKYEKIGIIGYCFGGMVVSRVASKGLFDSAIIAHPGPTSLNDIIAINIPTSWICAEEDDSFGPKARAEAEAVFAARKDKPDYIDYEFVDYKGTVHGFAARPNLGNPTIKDAFEGAFNQAVNWFKKTLS